MQSNRNASFQIQIRNYSFLFIYFSRDYIFFYAGDRSILSIDSSADIERNIGRWITIYKVSLNTLSRICEEIESSKLNKEVLYRLMIFTIIIEILIIKIRRIRDALDRSSHDPPCETLSAGAQRGEKQRAATRGYCHCHFHVSSRAGRQCLTQWAVL